MEAYKKTVEFFGGKTHFILWVVGAIDLALYFFANKPDLLGFLGIFNSTVIGGQVARSVGEDYCMTKPERG